MVKPLQFITYVRQNTIHIPEYGFQLGLERRTWLDTHFRWNNGHKGVRACRQAKEEPEDDRG